MEALTLAPVTMCSNSGLLTAVGTETVYDTTVIIEYAIKGVAYRKAAVTDGVTPTANLAGVTHTALTEDTGCIFLWCLDAAGTVVVEQGNVGSLDPDTGDFFVDPQMPPVPAAHAPFAYQIVKYTNTGTFAMGTSNWDATGVTDIIVNLMTLPSRVPTDATA